MSSDDRNLICNYDIIAINATWFIDSSELCDLVPGYRCDYVDIHEREKSEGHPEVNLLITLLKRCFLSLEFVITSFSVLFKSLMLKTQLVYHNTDK